MATQEEIDYLREKLDFGEDGRDVKLGTLIDTVRDTYEFNFKKFCDFFYKRFPAPELDDFIIQHLGLFRHNFPYEVLNQYRIQAIHYECWIHSDEFIDYRTVPLYHEEPFCGDLKKEVEVARELVILSCEEGFDKYNVDRSNTDQLFLFTEVALHYLYLIYLSSTFFDNNIFKTNYRPFNQKYMFIDYQAKFGARIRPRVMQHMEKALYMQRLEYQGKLHQDNLFS